MLGLGTDKAVDRQLRRTAGERELTNRLARSRNKEEKRKKEEGQPGRKYKSDVQDIVLDPYLKPKP